MKPVLETILDKNGSEQTVFNPTPRMILYGIKKAKNPHLSSADLCKLMGMDTQLPGRWAARYGTYFTDWLEEIIDTESGDDAEVLHAVGMIQATQKGNYQYWRDMARLKGVIKEEIKPTSVTINTDFSQILLAVGGDFEAARRKLLSAARGLGDPGGPGVVEPVAVGGPKGAGSGAGEVQAGSLALADPLGTDRGRAKQRSAVSAVSKQKALAGAYVVLDEGEVSSGSEEPPDDSDMAF